MVAVIDIYAMPRSGTNLLGSYFSRISGAHIVNTGGGRYPFRNGVNFEGSMGENIRIRKTCDINFRVKDEIHLELIGSKKLWPRQLLYRHTSLHHKKIVLLRNPFSVMQSMHAYHLKYRSHPHWNMLCTDNRSKFLKTYVKYYAAAGRPRFICLVIDQFFSDPNYRTSLLKTIEIEENFGDDEYECENGHRMTRSNLRCECGVVKGQGNFDFSQKVDLSRLNRPISDLLPCETIDEIKNFILSSSAFDGFLINDGEALSFE